ncbi:MAG: hypothetical protein J6S74_02090 [Alphaproteobacteria bacterium]|nr:hypothetical protein [Alphaproteobacteria bacterium]
MRTVTKDALIFSTTGAIAMALVLFGVKKCNDNADEKAALKAKAEIAESLLAGESELESENKTLVLQNDSLRKDLAVAGDSIVVLNDSIDVLNTKNTKLKNEKDSIVAELDDCKASKQPVKKTPVKKTPVVVSKPEKEPEKPAVVKPMPRVQIPCEPVIIKQEAKNENTGSTTVNVNTPGNTVNISNGGIINNFYGDCDKTEKADTVYKEVIKYRRKVIMGHAVSNESVRCK